MKKYTFKEHILLFTLRLMFILLFPFMLVIYTFEAIYALFASFFGNIAYYIKTIIEIDEGRM